MEQINNADPSIKLNDNDMLFLDDDIDLSFE